MIIWILIMAVTLFMFLLEWQWNFTINVKRIFIFFYVNLIIILIGFRYKIGWDYDSYVSIIKNKSWDKKTIEIISLGIFEFIQYFNLHSQIFFLITSIIFIVCLSKFIKEFSKYYYLSFFVYFIDYKGFMTQASTIRQSLAIGFFLISLIYIIRKKKYLKATCFLIVGIFCHISIIFTIPFILIRKIRVKNIFFIFIPLIVGLIKILFEYFISLLGGRYNFYLYNKFEGISQLKLVILNFLIYLMIIYLKERKQENQEDELYNLFKFGVLLYPFFTLYSSLFGRLVEYFMILNTIFLPNILLNSRVTLKRLFYLLLILLIIGSYVFKGIIYKKENINISHDNYYYKLNFKIFNEGE